MRTRVAYGLLLGCLAATLSGCGFVQKPQREAWRGQVELACLKSKQIVPTSFTRPIREIEGPGTCGLDHPFEVSAFSEGAVYVSPKARLGCPMAAAMNRWMDAVVQPAAMSRFGVRVAEIKNMASYGCRTRNNQRGARMSEHSFGNGLDIGGFILTDGRQVSVLNDWRRGTPEAQAFLREVHAGACGMFKTVLGPGSDRFHENHLHLDLARHGRSNSAYCRPKPVQPEPAMVQAPSTGEGGGYAGGQGAYRPAAYPQLERDGYGAQDRGYGAAGRQGEEAYPASEEGYPVEDGEEPALSYAPKQKLPDVFGSIVKEWPNPDEDYAGLEGDE